MSALDLTEAVEAAARVEIGMRQLFHHEDGSTSYSEFARVPLGADVAQKIVAAVAPVVEAQVRASAVAELTGARAAVADFIRWFEQHDAAVWADTPEEAADGLLQRLGNVIRAARTDT